MPLPAVNRRLAQAIVKTVPAPDLSLRGGRRPTWRPEREARGSALGVQSREGSCSSYKLSLKWCAPIASVAALTAQPLAALPPYGCGVPLAGCERLGQLQISGYSADRTDFQICHCDAPKGPWQSRAGSYDFADGFPAIRQSTARFPRRFAPRNDNPSAFTVLLTTCFLHRCSAGRGMPRTHNAPSMSRLFFAIDFRA